MENRLLEHRKKKGISTLEVAKYLNDILGGKTNRVIDYRNVWAVEKGKKGIPVNWLEPLSKLYMCSIDDLLK